MKPEDFGVPLLNQAHQLRAAALMRCGGWQLDPKTMTWLIPEEHRHRLFMEMHEMRLYAPNERFMLLGIPIRFTIGDDQCTPELQLVMEPILVARRNPP